MTLASKLLEILIRIFTMTLCLGTIIAASLTRHKLLDIKHNTNLSSTIKDELLVKTEATADVAISASVITIAEGIGMTIITIVLYLIKDMKFSGILESLATILDLLFILFLSCAFGAAAVLGGLSNTDWDDNYVQNPAYQKYGNILVAMKKSTVATTVLSLISCGLCVIFAVFLVAKLSRKCREHAGYTGL